MPLADAVVVVVAGLTVSVCVPLVVLLVKLESPLYLALMLCVPVASDEVLNCAEPLASEAEPSVVVPSRKVTVPVGVPL